MERATATELEEPPDRVGRRAEIVWLVFDGTYERDHEDIRTALADPIFDPRPGLTLAEAGLLAYKRSRFVHDTLESPRAIVRNPRRLFALAEWSALLDVSVFSILMVHYNLCLGTMVEHGGDRPDIEDYVGELDAMTSFGPYMATELGYGNNVAALRTEAVYDLPSETFVLNTPEPLAQKFMSYSGFGHIPKLAVVLARLKVADKDHGVFPFVVRISDENGLCPGIHAAQCPEKPVQGLDNGVTWFDHVPVPKRNLLLGDMGEFRADGCFRPLSGNPRRRFLRAMTRIQPGRLCVASAAVGAGRASVYVALRYAYQRLTNAPGRNDMPVIEYRNHQLALFTALAKVYAMTFLLNHAKREYIKHYNGEGADLTSLVSITKAICTWEMTDVVCVCRERCGAQGMFSVNRIADYVSLLQGLVTAEGDNQVLLVNTVGQLLAQADRKQGLAQPEPGGRSLQDPGRQRELLSHREAQMSQWARDKLAAETTRSYFDSWNSTIPSALAIGRVRGARLALERFTEAASHAEDGQVREALFVLSSLYGLIEIHRDAGWYLARGAVTAAEVEDLPATVDAMCDRLKPHITVLLEGFQLSADLLRAPIAADNYVDAYQRLAGARPPAAAVTPSPLSGGT